MSVVDINRARFRRLLLLLRDDDGPQLILQPSAAVFTGGTTVVCFVYLVRACSKLLVNWAFKQVRLLDLSEWMRAREESDHRRLKKEIRRDLYRVRENDASFTTWSCVLGSGLPSSAFAVMDYGTLYFKLSSALLQNTHLRRLDLYNLVIPFEEEPLIEFGRCIGLSNVNSLSIGYSTRQRLILGDHAHLHYPIQLDRSNFDLHHDTNQGGSDTTQGSSCFYRFLNAALLVNSNNSSLQELNLVAVTDFFGGSCCYDVALLAEGISRHATLRSLELEHCSMDSTAWQVLLGESGLGHDNNNITNLTLAGCGIGEIEIQIFLQHWRDDSLLQRICLSRNNIESFGAQALLRAARHHPALTGLDLSFNRRIDYQGLKQIGIELEFQPFLEDLNLSSCVDLLTASFGAKLEYSFAVFALLKGLILSGRIYHLCLFGNNQLTYFDEKEYVHLLHRNHLLCRTNGHDRIDDLMATIFSIQQQQPAQKYGASLIYVMLREFPQVLLDLYGASTAETEKVLRAGRHHEHKDESTAIDDVRGMVEILCTGCYVVVRIAFLWWVCYRL